MFQGYQIKLRGNPWSKRDTSMECNQALQMMVFVIEKLADLGWRFMCSMDVVGLCLPVIMHDYVTMLKSSEV